MNINERESEKEAQNRWRREKNQKKTEWRINRKITKLCLFLDLLSQMRTNMYVIHDHKKREREVEHVTVLKTTTEMRDNKRGTLLNGYELTKRIFSCLCCCVRKRKRKRNESTSEHWYWLYYQRINIYPENKRDKWRRFTLIPPVTQCRCRKEDEDEEEENTLRELTTMLLMNDHYRLMANLDDRNYKQLLREH